MKIRFIIMLAIVSIACLGCSKKIAAVMVTNLIELPGTVQFADGCSVNVTISDDDLVKYKLYDRAGSLQIESHDRAGASQRWCLYWDPRSRILWFYSGDIGVFCWSLDKTDKYQEINVGPNTPQLIKAMPDEFYERIAGTLKNSFSNIRSSGRP